MDKLKNGDYLAPQVEMMELSAQGIICESEFTVPNPFTGNDPEETDW